MDRPLPPTLVRSRRRSLVLRLALPIVLITAAILWLPGWLRPSIRRDLIRTAIVTRGDVSASLSASGLVMPAVERVIASPLDARVLRILQRPGVRVHRGDPVVQLDLSESETALVRAENDLDVKDNQQRQIRLRYEQSLADLDGQVKIKTLELETKRAELAERQQLAARGLVSKEELRQAELAATEAQVQLEQLQRQRAQAGETTSLELEGLALERRTLDRDLNDKRHQLDLATTKSDRDGVLTWVVAEEGALVHRGDVLARIADLSSFRVDATTSDVHTGRIRPGLPAIVQLDDLKLNGTVSEVLPAVENGTIRFTVTLADSANARLRPSLRVDVQVLTDRRTRTLTLRRGPFADASGSPVVFVLRGPHAVRTPITLGVSDFDQVEVTSGLHEGDEVIISDMHDYAGVPELTVR